MKKIYKYIFILSIFALFTVACDNNIDINSEIEEKEEDVEKVVLEEDLVPEKGGEIALSIRNIDSTNPLLNEDKSVEEFYKLIFEPLFELDNNLKPIPNLINSYEYSADGRTLYLELRDDIYWHDGEKFDSEDVIYSLDTIYNSEKEVYKKVVANILNYTKEDEYRVKLSLKQAYSGTLYALNFPIIPEHIYSKGDSNIIGNGMYRVSKYTSLKEIVLEINEKYFKELPYIQTIKATITPNEESDLSLFENNQIDFVNTDSIDWSKYSQTDNGNIYEYNTNYYDFLGFNFLNQKLNNKNLRQAIAYTIDKEKIKKDIFLGHVSLCDLPINPDSYLNIDKKYSYSLDKAKELLKKDGIYKEDSTDYLKLNLLVSNENKERVDAAYIIKENLKDIHIDLNILEVDSTEFMERLKNKDFDLILAGWSLSSIPDLTFAFHSSQIEEGTNYISYKDDTMDSLLRKCFSTYKEEDIEKSYKELYNHIYEELPYISLYYRKKAILINNNIKGEIKPYIDNIYEGINNLYILEKRKE